MARSCTEIILNGTSLSPVLTKIVARSASAEHTQKVAAAVRSVESTNVRGSVAVLFALCESIIRLSAPVPTTMARSCGGGGRGGGRGDGDSGGKGLGECRGGNEKFVLEFITSLFKQAHTHYIAAITTSRVTTAKAADSAATTCQRL